MNVGPAGVAIVGGAEETAEWVEDRSLEEMIFSVTRDAIADAGLTIDQVDGVVISGNDQLDGRVISCMVSAGPAGGVGKNVTTIASSPEHAFIYGCLRLRAGQGRNVVVVGWSKPSESRFPEHAELVSAEPFILRPHGMNDTVAAALQASMLGADFGEAEARGPSEQGADGDPIVAWPLTRSQLPARADGACALVLATPEWAGGRRAAWVRGIGWSTDRYELGDRDLREMPSLRAAARMAGVEAAPSNGAVEFVEVNAPSAPARRASLAALGVQRPPEDLHVDGSVAAARPAFVAGLLRIRAAAERFRRPADTDQPPPGHAIAASLHGFAGQGAVVVVLAGSPED